MKHSTHKSKLKLKQQTLRLLSSADLKSIAGGKVEPNTEDYNCTDWCCPSYGGCPEQL